MFGILLFLLFIFIILVSIMIVFINPFGKSKSLFAVVPAVLGVVLYLSRDRFYPNVEGLFSILIKLGPFVFVLVTLLLVFKIQLSHNRPS